MILPLARGRELNGLSACQAVRAGRRLFEEVLHYRALGGASEPICVLASRLFNFEVRRLGKAFPDVSLLAL